MQPKNFGKEKKKEKEKREIGGKKEEIKGVKNRRERLKFRLITSNSGQSSKY